MCSHPVMPVYDTPLQSTVCTLVYAGQDSEGVADLEIHPEHCHIRGGSYCMPLNPNQHMN